jgi:hypothetical protein
MAGYPWGLFDFVHNEGTVSARPRKSYYALKAYHALTQTPLRLQCQAGEDVERGGCGFLAGLAEDHRQITILLSNFGTHTNQYRIRVANLPWKDSTLVDTLLLDSRHNLEPAPRKSCTPKAELAIEGGMEVPSVCLIRLLPESASTK